MLAGSLCIEEIERLGDHIDSCSKCLSTLESLSATEDTIEKHLNVDSKAFSVLLDSGYLEVAKNFKMPAIEQQTFPEAPFQIQQFRVTRIVGQGGMGVVYEATDESLNRTVAIKVFKLGSATGSRTTERRFRLESLALAKLEHENIVRLYDLKYSDLGPFLVLEFINGGSLEKNMKILNSTFSQKLNFFLKLVGAVVYCHENSVIHRDIKPSNILVAENDKPMLTDFGIAKALDDSWMNTYKNTTTGVIIGTPAYMSPEMATGDHSSVDESTDIYSLGAVFYYLLCARPPYVGNNIAEVLEIIRKGHVVSPRKFNADIPSGFDAICRKCLAKDKNLRYTSAKQLYEDLTQLSQGSKPTALILNQRQQRRQFIGLSAFALIALGSSLFGLHYFADYPNRYHLRVAARLRQGETVDLDGSKWHRLVLGHDTTALTLLDDSNTLVLHSDQSAACILLETVPSLSVRITAEIRHDKTGDSDAGVGFIFFHNENLNRPNVTMASGIIVRFNDLTPLPPFGKDVIKNLPPPQIVVKVYQNKATIIDGIVDTLSEEKRRTKEFPVGVVVENKIDLFRHFMFEVNESALKVYWQHDMQSEKKELVFSLRNLDIPLSAESFGFGAFVQDGTATFRNVKIQQIGSKK